MEFLWISLWERMGGKQGKDNQRKEKEEEEEREDHYFEYVYENYRCPYRQEVFSFSEV